MIVRLSQQSFGWILRKFLRAGTLRLAERGWGITRTGRFACVTNYRDMEQPKGTISRGNLVSDFLRGTESVGEYLEEVRANTNSYTGFNLIVGEFSANMAMKWVIVRIAAKENGSSKPEHTASATRCWIRRGQKWILVKGNCKK